MVTSTRETVFISITTPTRTESYRLYPSRLYRRDPWVCRYRRNRRNTVHTWNHTPKPFQRKKNNKITKSKFIFAHICSFTSRTFVLKKCIDTHIGMICGRPGKKLKKTCRLGINRAWFRGVIFERTVNITTLVSTAKRFWGQRQFETRRPDRHFSSCPKKKHTKMQKLKVGTKKSAFKLNKKKVFFFLWLGLLSCT